MEYRTNKPDSSSGKSFPRKRRFSKRAARRGKETDPKTYMIVGVVGLCLLFFLIVAVRTHNKNAAKPLYVAPYQAQQAPLDATRVAVPVPHSEIFWPNKLREEGRLLLKEAMPETGGIDQEKLKAAEKKLTAAIDSYRRLKINHPNTTELDEEIVKTNALLVVVKKSKSL